VKAGDRVVLVLSNGPSFFHALLACIASGAIAVPAPTPATSRPLAFQERLRGIVADCAPSMLLTEPWWLGAMEDAISSGTACTSVAYTSLVEEGTPGEAAQSPHPPSCDIALLQYTSGSTRHPRGIIVTHDALQASCSQAADFYAESVDDVAVTWVPLYHDMGLITGVMRPLYSGYATVLLQPHEFSRAPASWLEAVHVCRGSLSSAPNFAFDLCVRKVDPARVSAWDLSCWRIARNASEVVRPETADRFVRYFAPANFPVSSMCPSYGLAEATLAVTSCGPQVLPKRLWVLASALRLGEVVPVDARTSAGNEHSARQLMSSGTALAQARIRAGNGMGLMGEISISGPQMTPGVWGGTEVVPPHDVTAVNWRRTGDIGFIYQGHLFVVGRTDDTVVHRGMNFHLSDVIAACGSIPQVRRGRLAHFLARSGTSDEWEVHVVAELQADAENTPSALTTLATEVKRTLARTLGLFVSWVGFIPAGTLPVTTSGKVRASEVRRRFEADLLPIIRTSGDENDVAASAES
jgi:acyl-CoA synthetase (AMP-forming)/AMP-acid ligase II